MFDFFGNKRRLAAARALAETLARHRWGLKMSSTSIGIGPIVTAGGKYRYPKDWIKPSDGISWGTMCYQWVMGNEICGEVAQIIPRSRGLADALRVGNLTLEVLECDFSYRREHILAGKYSDPKEEAFPQ